MHTKKLHLNKLMHKQSSSSSSSSLEQQTKQTKFKPLCHLKTTVHTHCTSCPHNAHDIISLKSEMLKIQHNIKLNSQPFQALFISSSLSRLSPKICVWKASGKSFAVRGNRTSIAPPSRRNVLHAHTEKFRFDKFFDYVFVCKFDAIHKK